MRKTSEGPIRLNSQDGSQIDVIYINSSPNAVVEFLLFYLNPDNKKSGGFFLQNPKRQKTSKKKKRKLNKPLISIDEFCPSPVSVSTLALRNSAVRVCVGGSPFLKRIVNLFNFFSGIHFGILGVKLGFW